MKMRNSFLLISAALVLLGRVVRAEDCTLSGVTVARDGAAVPGIEVYVMAFRAFRGATHKNVTSGSDGAFTLANLPCGKYMVSARQADVMQREYDPANPGYLMVDIKKQPKVRLVVPNVDRLAAMLHAPAGAESGNADGAKAAEDAAISQLRRQYFERINASQLAEFDGAPLLQQKRMFMMAFTTYLSGIMAGDAATASASKAAAAAPQKRGWRTMVNRRGQPDEALLLGSEARAHSEEDAAAKRQLANAAAVVRQALPAEDPSIFGRGPEIQQARLFLRAVAALPKNRAQCSMWGLWAIDTEDVNQGHGWGSSLIPFLDDPATVRWAELNTASKCKLVDAAGPKMIENAQKLEHDGSIENVKLVAQRLDTGRLGPKSTILQVFGNDGVNKYEQSKSTDEQLELYRASLIMQLCWFAAYAAL